MIRQVPHRQFLIIGRGRLATHLGYYLRLLNIEPSVWHREMEPSTLATLSQQAAKILICIKDDAIHQFVLENGLPPEKCVHFSGTLHTPLAARLHPLCTFSGDAYDLEAYKKIPFIGELGGVELSDVFPEFENPFFQIPRDLFALYHALCVLGGNGMTALWSYVVEKFETDLGLPADLLRPFAEKTLENIFRDSRSALTGPWVRGDINTIQKNIQSIDDPQFKKVYEALAKTQLRQDFLMNTNDTFATKNQEGEL